MNATLLGQAMHRVRKWMKRGGAAEPRPTVCSIWAGSASTMTP